VTLAELHRGHVHLRVFPDLRIDEAGKEHAEQSLGEAVAAQRPVPEKRLGNLAAAGKFGLRGEVGHREGHPLKVSGV